MRIWEEEEEDGVSEDGVSEDGVSEDGVSEFRSFGGSEVRRFGGSEVRRFGGSVLETETLMFVDHAAELFAYGFSLG